MIKKAKMNCVFCGKRTLYQEITVRLRPGNIKCRAWQCTACKEYYMDSGPVEQSLILNQLQRGLKVKIGQLGNSEIFRFPVEIAKLLKLKKGGEVTAKVVNNKGKLVLEITPN